MAALEAICRHAPNNSTPQVYNAYALTTSAYLSAQALPMLLTPRIIAAMLSPDMRSATDLEYYLSRLLGLTLLALAALSLVLTGTVPLTTSPPAATTTDTDDARAPYAQPTLLVTFLYHAACAFYSYAVWTQGGLFPHLVGVIGSAGLAAVGLWCILFATTEGRFSKKTGADKRTSSYPFKNVEADKRKAGKRL